MGLNPNQRFYASPQQNNKGFFLFQFLSALKSYLQTRIRQLGFFLYATFEVMVNIANGSKAWIVQRMFWGRSSLYRTAFHVMISIVTIVAVLSGISSRLNISAQASEGLDITSGLIGRQDIFSQSGTAESIAALDGNVPDYPVYKHIVQPGETLSQIAQLYNIKSSTIRWANSMGNDTIRPGQVLRIPGIDGAFIKVAKGDTLEGIAKKNKGNVADIVDLNSSVLDVNNPQITVGMELFVPGGEIPLPPVVAVARSGGGSTPVHGGTSGGINVPPGTLINPLINCPGYVYIRGFSPWHGGVDLARAGGCWESSAGAGRVIQAGWGNAGEGFHVVVDHGNGLWTRYYHGTGQFAVKVGDIVKAGQSLQYMGRTGNATGVHLHFEVVINHVKVNPENYVRVR